MKARDLRERSTEDLAELEKSLAEERFQNKFKNFTNRLDDTSQILKSKRDLARVKLILTERKHGITVVSKPAPSKPVAAPKPAAEKPVVAKAAEAKAEESVKAEAAPAKKGKADTTAKAAAPKKPKATKTEKGDTK